jgi:hypothetical protein
MTERLWPRWLDADDASDYLSLRIDAFSRLIRAGRIPAPSHHLGERTARWDREKLDLAMVGETASSADTTGTTNPTDTRKAVDALVEKIKSRARSRTRR